MSSCLPKLPELLALALLCATAAADERWAPNAAAGPVKQRLVSGNACGPAALLAAMESGDEAWQGAAARLPGESDRSKLLYIIRAHGTRPSASLRGRNRWSGDGVNAEDLTAIAGELAAIGGQRAPRHEALFLGRFDNPRKLLRRCHDRLRDSLRKGFPPVLSLRRHVFRDGAWQTVRGHFVTVVRVPEKLDRKANSFTFTYFDPWSGTKDEGTIRIPPRSVLAADGAESPCLEALVPEAEIGRSQVRAGERNAVVPASAIGRW